MSSVQGLSDNLKGVDTSQLSIKAQTAFKQLQTRIEALSEEALAPAQLKEELRLEFNTFTWSIEPADKVLLFAIRDHFKPFLEEDKSSDIKSDEGSTIQEEQSEFDPEELFERVKDALGSSFELAIAEKVVSQFTEPEKISDDHYKMTYQPGKLDKTVEFEYIVRGNEITIVFRTETGQKEYEETSVKRIQVDPRTYGPKDWVGEDIATAIPKEVENWLLNVIAKEEDGEVHV